MDRRRCPRIACYQRAWLTLLGQGRRSIAGRAVELAGCGLRVVVDEPIALSAPVSLETGDWLGLGEVSSCRPEYSHYVIGIQLEQAVIGLRDLAEGRREWFAQAAPVPARSLTLNVSQQLLA